MSRPVGLRTAAAYIAWVGGTVVGAACAAGPVTRVSTATAPGREASIPLPIPRSRDTAWAEIFVPSRVRVARAAVVFINRELDRYAFDDRDWRTMCGRADCALVRVGLPREDAIAVELQRVRNAALGGDSAVFMALRLGGERTGHPELRDANIVLFGFSAAGSFGPTFAARHPDRTIGFVRYHSSLRGLPVDTATLASIPSLTISGERDETAISEDSRTLWRVLRARGAPSAYVNHIGQPHLSIDGLVDAGGAIRSWTEALIRRRATAPPLLARTSDGWVVDDSTGDVYPVHGDIPRTPSASWVPDAPTAFALRRLKGMCAQVSLMDAIGVLGPGTKLESEDTSVCHFSQGAKRRDLWVSAYSHDSDSAAVASLRQAPGAVPIAALGDAAILWLDAKGKCSTIGGARSLWTFMLSACGEGFGVPSDSIRLRALAQQVLGEPRWVRNSRRSLFTPGGA